MLKLRMFDALLPYFGGKRKLCPLIFKGVRKYIPREQWQGKVFVDAFLGSSAVSLYAKAQGFKIICNDIAERCFIAGKALIENNNIYISNTDICRLILPNEGNDHDIEREFVPDVFSMRHAICLDNAFQNCQSYLEKYLLLKYIFRIRPYSKFSSPNAFNRPFEDGRFDEIKETYRGAMSNNLKTPLELLDILKDKVNAGIFSNGFKNEVYKEDVFDFVNKVNGDVLYLDPPYSGTLSYEGEYNILDKILGEVKPKSKFSANTGMDVLDELLAVSGKFPLWVISFGNAGGKNELSRLVEIVSKYRKCEAKEFAYKHCEAMASEEHKQQCREWLIVGYKAD
jgi:adenine-specific DNA-methyltransferase